MTTADTPRAEKRPEALPYRLLAPILVRLFVPEMAFLDRGHQIAGELRKRPGSMNLYGSR